MNLGLIKKTWQLYTILHPKEKGPKIRPFLNQKYLSVPYFKDKPKGPFLVSVI